MSCYESRENRSEVSLNWVHGLMLLAMMLIATSFPVGKLIADALPSDIMMLIRFVFAALLFAPFVMYQHGVRLPAPRRLLSYAFLSIPLVGFFWCMFEALKYTSSVTTGALYTTVPAMTAAFSFMLNGERASPKKSLGLLLGTVGAIWIVFRGDLASLISLDLNKGDGIFFVGAIALSVYSAMIKRVYSGEPMVIMTFYVIVFGAMWMLLVSLPKLGEIEWINTSATVYLGLAYLALFTTLVSFFLLQFSTVKIGPTKVAAYSFLNPVFVILLTAMLGMDEFSMSMIPGVVMVFFAMLAIQRSD